MSEMLFLLKSNFPDAKAGSQLYYCPDCATLTGVLTYFPQLRDRLVIREVDFQRPRAEVAEIFGPDHPGCPLLVFSEGTDVSQVAGVQTSAGGRKYLTGASSIGNYWAAAYKVSAPHP